MAHIPAPHCVACTFMTLHLHRLPLPTRSCFHRRLFVCQQDYAKLLDRCSQNFGGHNPPDIKNSKWGTPNLQKLWGPEIHFIYPNRRRHNRRITGTIIFFKSEQNRRDIARKLGACHGRLQTKRNGPGTCFYDISVSN